MLIGNVDVATRPLIIAEIGNNHEGDLATAEKLVRAAAECGVDAVKFQTFQTELYVDRRDATRSARLKRFELTPAQFARLADLARRLDLLFISTPFDLPSARVLEPLVDAYKIASGDNDFFPLVRQVARTDRPIILSTGSSDLARIHSAVRCVAAERSDAALADGLALLHCVSSYPVPADQANLRAITTLATEFSVTVGYSDHTIGADACVLAIALGARIIEKHFTLAHDYSEFRDHQLSATPDEMRELVLRVRDAEAMLGVGDKSPQACEEEIASAIRRSIIAVRELPAGHAVTFEDLAWVRPAGGLPPGAEGLVIGKHLRRKVAAGEPLAATDVE